MKVKKAVIAAAGLGTRVLPATKSLPKEMLPIVDKPSIQFIVEECAAAGITDILIITSRGKGVMEDHFDRSPELEQRLLSGGKTALYDEMVSIANIANIHYLRQKETRGLGHAIGCARSFVGNEPFAVLYGDDVVIGPISATAELCAVYEEFGKGVVGIKPVPEEKLASYCTLQVEAVRERIYAVSDMIEKPRPEQIMSHFAILGRCVLESSIFDIIDTLPPGAGGEIQLTDAMKKVANKTGMMGIVYDGKRYDMGNKLGMLQAIVEAGLGHPETGVAFAEYLQGLIQEL